MNERIKGLTLDLQRALEHAAQAHAGTATFLRNVLAQVPDAPSNAPIEACRRIAEACDFRLIHRDELADVIGVVTVACGQDHETAEEDEKLERLLSALNDRLGVYLRAQLHAPLEGIDR